MDESDNNEAKVMVTSSKPYIPPRESGHLIKDISLEVNRNKSCICFWKIKNFYCNLFKYLNTS